MKGQTKRHANSALDELTRRQGGRGHKITGLASQLSPRDRARAALPPAAGPSARRVDADAKAKRRAKGRAAKATRKAQRRRR